MAASSIRMSPEPCRSVAFGSIGASYVKIGSKMEHPTRIMVLQNLTDESLWFSFDGVDDHLPLAANGYLVLDITSNKTLEKGFFLVKGQKLYVKQLGVPTTGAVYLTTFHGDEVQ